VREFLAAKVEHGAALAHCDSARHRAHLEAVRAQQQADRLTRLVNADAARYAGELGRQWGELRAAVRQTAQCVLDGPGRFGRHRREVCEAQAELQQWANNWRAVVPDLPVDPGQLAHIAAGYDSHRTHQAIQAYARAAAEHARPEHGAAVEVAQAAVEHARQTDDAYHRAADRYHRQLIRYGGLVYAPDPDATLDSTEQRVTSLSVQHTETRRRITTLLSEPALRSLPAERLQIERDAWRHDREAQRRLRQQPRRPVELMESRSKHRHIPDRLRHAPSPNRGGGISI
jgi:hypothetical protein